MHHDPKVSDFNALHDWAGFMDDANDQWFQSSYSHKRSLDSGWVKSEQDYEEREGTFTTHILLRSRSVLGIS